MLITTTIPYVNARPHVGFLLELVQADVLARHHRRRGAAVRLQTGTDDNSLKNVIAAEAAGTSTTELVDRNAAAFAALHEPYDLDFDDVLHTSRDPRHRAGVERLWHACAHDLYRGRYEGRYCVGCEQFYAEAELPGGRCPEHDTPPERVAEQNWFFRLSRYAAPLREAIETGRLRIQPAQRRNEVLAFLAGGLDDISVSRATERARGWGIPVPGDPGQVIYVWWDALGNYVTAPGEQTWRAAERRIHLLGKGVLRFHAVYWPAMLLSAGLSLPTDLVVHDYLTRRRPQDQQVRRCHCRPARAGRPVRRGRRALVAAARRAAGRRHRLHARQAGGAHQRRAGGRHRQPRPPGHLDDPPLPRRRPAGPCGPAAVRHPGRRRRDRGFRPA